jgi:hypothetical protein
MADAWLKRTAIQLILGTALVMGGLTIAGWYAWCDWVPDPIIARLPGATKSEVQEWLGQPTESDHEGRLERWRYRRSFRLAEFQVDFSAKGQIDDWSYVR